MPVVKRRKLCWPDHHAIWGRVKGDGLRFRLVAALIVTALLGGCVHDTSDSIRSDPRERLSFVIAGDRHRVARKIQACLDGRYSVGSRASHTFAVIDESPPAIPGTPGNAVVTLWQGGIFGSRVL